MKKNTRSRLRAASILLALCVPLIAASATDPQDPQAIVKQSTERVLQILRTEGEGLKNNPQRVYQIINELILPNFDFRQMSKWVLGLAWRDASESQRDEFTKQFELLLVRTYSNALVEFRDQTVDFLPMRDRSDSEVAVRATINRAAGPSVPITYQMHKSNDVWRIYDIAIEGVSLVITYRSSFAQEIKRNGIDGLIKRLAEKNQAVSG